MTVHAVTDDVWEVRADVGLPGGIKFPARMTVVRLPDGRLVLHSPVRLSDEDAAALERLGDPAFVVAPNGFHHLFVTPTLERYPGAEAWISPALVRKRRDLDGAHVLTREVAPFAGSLVPHHVPGSPAVEEVCFWHAPSGTLIVTDLFFNIQATSNRRTRWLFKSYGVFGRPKQSPLVRWATRDKSAAARAAHELCALPTECLVPAHGEVVTNDAARVLADVLAPMARHAPAALTDGRTK
ncbi:MAG: DUF4336 domain-containing protein [Myxococcales bacterium]|nr:DUF4336 domain-containing protein [Myxococcales bacterium]